MQLKSGLAEVFGTELTKGHKYTFHHGSKVAVFTWHGCQLTLEGSADAYTSKETPMNYYLNLHGCLEKMRNEAAIQLSKGPIVLVCGPTDVGKTTLCRILLNYAVRRGHTSMFVDLDVGQGSIGIPGVVGLHSIEVPASVESGFSQVAPLLYHFGSTSPGTNLNLYEHQIKRCANAVKSKFEVDPKAKYSGVFINTCGWTTGGGLKALKSAAEFLEVDVVLVIDQEKLYNELERELPKFVKIVFTPKSGGVVTRSKEFRSEQRDARIREYFYGIGLKGSKVTQFYPHSFDVPFQLMKIYKVGAPSIPDSCMPIGMIADDNQTKLVPVSPGMVLLHHMLSLTFSTDKNDALESNIQGFVCVTGVDMEKQTIKVLSPRPKPLPTDCIFLLSDVQFMDSH